MIDALVVGSGPAGAAAARLLAQAGWSVALVEKTAFPRRKVCGEFISATTLPVLADCGVAAAFTAAAGPVVTRIGLYAGDRIAASREARNWGRALGREHLDMLLRDAAVAAGAVLHQPAEVLVVHRTAVGHVCTIKAGDDIRETEARIVIAAGGSWSSKGVFAPPSRDAAPSDLLAFKGHFRGAALPDGLMPLLAFPGGYGGMVQTDDGRVSLSCCIRRDVLADARLRHPGKAAQAVLAHICATTRGVRSALQGTIADGALLAAGPIRPGIRPRYRDGIFFTGNIAGEAHPIVAEGISMAIQASGLLARRLIAAGPPRAADTAVGADYARAWQLQFAPRIRAAAMFAQSAMHPPTRAAAAALISAVPAILDVGARLSGKRAGSRCLEQQPAQ